MYKGMSSPLVGQMAFRATLFSALAQSKLFLASQGTGKLSQPEFFVAGAMTGAAASFADVPFAVLVVVFDVCLMVHSSAAPKLRSSHLE